MPRTGELPFEIAAPATRRSTEPPAWSVGDLLEHVRGRLEGTFPLVAVSGELASVSRPGSGHVYFSLKDERGVLRAVLFRTAARRVRFPLADGVQVVAQGRLSVYTQRGDLQLMVETLSRAGLGELARAFEELKARLRDEGLFDAARKRALPLVPGRVGIVTSRTGAALRDIVHVAQRRFPGIGLFVAPVQVQGKGAARQIAQAVRWLSASGRVDVIIVARGGGSLEDLWAFNEEEVARAIHGAAVPVVSGVGHETDFTIADLVADVRAPTPSAAAEVVVPERRELAASVHDLLAAATRCQLQRLARGRERLARNTPTVARLRHGVELRRQRTDDLDNRARRALSHRLDRAREDTRALEQRLAAQAPERRLALGRERLARLVEAAGERVERRVASHRATLDGLRGRLHALGPMQVLGRGYAIVQRPGGGVVRGAGDVVAGERIRVRLAVGSIEAEVTSTRQATSGRHGTSGRQGTSTREEP